jgi:hypothetical protein
MRLLDRFLQIVAADKAARPQSIAARRVAPADLPRGFIDPRQREGTRRIALTLDQPTFDRVRDHAAKHAISFAAAARALIEAGAGGSPPQHTTASTKGE